MVITNSLVAGRNRSAIVVGLGLNVISANRKAANFFDVSSLMLIKNKKLVCNDSAYNTQLKKAVYGAIIDNRTRSFFWKDNSFGHPVRVDVFSTIPSNTYPAETATLAFDTLAIKGKVRAEDFRAFYDLTMTEMALIELLHLGHSLLECAEVRGVAKTTVRWTLGNIFTKTGVRSQKELTLLSQIFEE